MIGRWNCIKKRKTFPNSDTQTARIGSWNVPTPFQPINRIVIRPQTPVQPRSSISIGGSKVGGTSDAHRLSVQFLSCCFWPKNCQIIGSRPHLWGCRPWEIMDPPLISSNFECPRTLIPTLVICETFCYCFNKTFLQSFTFVLTFLHFKFKTLLRFQCDPEFVVGSHPYFPPIT